MIRMARLFVLPLLAAMLSACAGGETEADRAARDGILLLGNGTEPKTLDPGLVSGVPERDIVGALFEGLVIIDPDDPSSVLPGVAESWEANEDFTTWTFQLRKDAKWSNGDPVTSADFVYGWRRALTPALGFEQVEMLYPVRGAEAFNRDDAGWDQVGVETPDPQTLVVHMENSTPSFLQLALTFPYAPIHRATVEASGDMADRSSPWTVPGKLVGNGPFMLSRWETNQILEVTGNPHYWDADNVALKAIRFFPIENDSTEEKAFLSGRLHVTRTIPTDKLPSYADDPRLRIDPMAGTYFYVLNTRRPPLDDPRVRRALSLAIDRKAIVERVTQGGQIPAGGIVPAAFADMETVPAPKVDPARARALLTEAGYPDGKGFPKFEVLLNTGEGHRKIAQAIQAMWKDNLGIDVGLYNQEWKVYLDTRANRDFDIARLGWVAPYLDPVAMLENSLTGSPNNDAGWSNATFDALIAQSRRTANEEERLRLLEQADRLLAREVPIIPIYYYTTPILIDSRVKGWNPHPRASHPYKFVSLESG